MRAAAAYGRVADSDLGLDYEDGGAAAVSVAATAAPATVENQCCSPLGGVEGVVRWSSVRSIMRGHQGHGSHHFQPWQGRRVARAAPRSAGA